MDKKRSIKKIFHYIYYGINTVYSFSRIRVICSIISKIIYYFLWFFYSSYFVRFVLEVIEAERSINEIMIDIAIIGVVSLLLNIYQYMCKNVFIPLQDIIVHKRIYNKIYRKAGNVELECFERPEYYNKFSIALDNIANKLGENVDNFSEIVGGFIGGIFASWTMVEIDPFTILFIIAPLIGNFIFAPKMNHIFYNRYKEGVPYERRLEYTNRVMYLQKYAKELRLYNVYNIIKKIFTEATYSKSSIWEKYFKKAFTYGFLQYFFSYVFIFEGILLYGAYRAIIHNSISFSQAAVLTSVMITASWIWVRVINAYNKTVEISLVIEEFKNFLDYKEKIPEDSDGIVPDEPFNSIEFENVSFSYDGKINIIDDVSFKLNIGDRVAFVGHNGAGKSTIVKLLLRLYDPTEGRILLNGIDIKEYNLQAYRNLFSCAFQDYEIFSCSIKENVLMGRTGTDEDVVEALIKAGIYEKIQSLPNGIHTVLTREFDKDGALLSGGELQKIICARVFVDQSTISVFDEPSSALDPISENELFQSIISSVNNRIGIFISHRLSSVKDADYVFMFEKGRIIEEGSHSDLMKNNCSYAKMYRMQVKNYFEFDLKSEEEING